MPRPAHSLDDLVLFVAVARHASFVQAARRLRVPASSVSRSVSRLEDDIGVRLLQRTSRKVTLTEEGRQLLLRAAGPLDELGQSMEAATAGKAVAAGTIRVTAPAYSGSTRVARALGAFVRAHPQVTIELDASNVVRDLIDDGFDLAVRVGPLPDGDLVARRLWDGQTQLFASPDLAARIQKKSRRLTPERLAQVPAVMTRRGSCWRFRAPDDSLIEVAPNGRFLVNDPRAAVEAARQGVGVLLAPIEVVPKGDRSLLPIDVPFGRPEPVVLYAVYPGHRLLPLRVKLLLDWLSEAARVGGEPKRPFGRRT